jgi:hypothetical protein
MGGAKGQNSGEGENVAGTEKIITAEEAWARVFTDEQYGSSNRDAFNYAWKSTKKAGDNLVTDLHPDYAIFTLLNAKEVWSLWVDSSLQITTRWGSRDPKTFIRTLKRMYMRNKTKDAVNVVINKQLARQERLGFSVCMSPLPKIPITVPEPTPVPEGKVKKVTRKKETIEQPVVKPRRIVII